MLKRFNKTILIAEACENHFGNIKYAKEMVVKSKNSGADFVSTPYSRRRNVKECSKIK